MTSSQTQRRQPGARAAATNASPDRLQRPLAQLDEGRLAADRDRPRVRVVEAGNEREQRRLTGAAPADDAHTSSCRDMKLERVEDTVGAEHADDAVDDD